MEADTVMAVEEEENTRWAALNSAATRSSSARSTSRSKSKRSSRRKGSAEDTPLLAAVSGSASSINSDDDTAHLAPWLGAKEVDGKPWWKRPSIFWVLPPLFAFTIAFGGVVVPKINLILTLICRDHLSDRATLDPTFTYLPVIYGEDNPQCRIPEVQALVSRFQLVLNLIAGTLAAVASPRLGFLSDGYGRNRIIALATFGTLLGEVITVCVAARPDYFPVKILFLGAVFDGMFGSVTTAIALTQSYAADCTPPERRNVAFGYFHGVLFSGIALGPLAAGYLIKWTGNILVVFYPVLVCMSFFLFFMLFVVPESVSKERQRANREKRGIRLFDVSKLSSTSWRDLNPLALFEPLSILWPAAKNKPTTTSSKRALRDLRVNLIALASVDAAIFGVAMGTMTIIVIYAEYMFGWGNFESSIFVSIISSVRVVVLLVILPTATRLVRGPQSDRPLVNTGSDMLDIIIIRISVAFDMLGYIGYCVVRSGPLLILSGAMAAVGAMAAPTVQSSLTKHVPADRTGQLLGAIGLLHALARVVAPTIFNLIYSSTVATMPQTVFICLTVVIFVALMVSWFIKPHIYMDESTIVTAESDDDDDDDV
ncbi:hypothetical protein AJ80_08374 [Polytolypa hystricis UAMH7299]|uniref:Major facilitator superfamily (MFS) profile domain-containing protein n=1 Tax=Polytolypa hystricis (strain UAMH7299) TaxID=1447883 RepID=A0A2B7X873_POLH7|nr:hypothetical protein AJ80_08374 [Polytolypa hystricis UAMH7299]